MSERLGEYVRVPKVFGDDLLKLVMTNTRGDMVLVEIPIEDAEGRVVEYVNRWYVRESVHAA